MFEIKVPYVIDHFGAGGNCLGLALKHYIYLQIEIVSEKKYANAWVEKGFQAVYEKANLACPSIDVFIKDCDFYQQEGIAYETACIVAGAYAANILLHEPFHKYELFDVCTKISGAMSCVASILFGSFTSCFMEDDKPNMIRSLVNQDYRFCILSPTQKEDIIEHANNEMVYDMGKCASIPKALEIGNPMILQRACTQTQLRKNVSNISSLYEGILKKYALTTFYQSDGKTMIAMVENEWKGYALLQTMKEVEHDWHSVMCEVDRKGIQIEVK